MVSDPRLGEVHHLGYVRFYNQYRHLSNAHTCVIGTEPLLRAFYDFYVQPMHSSGVLNISPCDFPSHVSMLHSNSLPKVLATFTLAWLAWRILRRYLFPHPLDRVPGLEAPSRIAGNLTQIFAQDGWDFHDKMADKYGGIFRFQGFFGEPLLYVHDPVALQYITAKDERSFESSDDIILVNDIVFGPGLLASTGAHHRKQRKMMNPAFSLSRIRSMTPCFYDVAKDMCDSILRAVSEGPNTVDMMDKLSRTALEVVGRGILSTTFEAFRDDYTPPYLSSIRNYARVITFPEFILPRFLTPTFVYSLGSPKFRRWIIDRLPWKNLQVLKGIIDTMHNTSTALFQDHLDAFGRGEGEDKDVLSILMKANNSASDEDRLPDSEILAQITTINFAAFDTTTSAISRILYILCEHPEVQDRLRREVTSAAARHPNGEIPYDELVGLPFLDAVCRETFRVYTPLPLIMKQVQQDIVLPLSKAYPSTYGAPFTELFVPKGTMFVVALNACNRDYAIWGEDARIWKPERWLKPLPESVTKANIPGVYSNLMTFYGGQKACIGFKFAELETKVVVSMLLRNFRLSFGDKKIIWKMNGLNQPITEDAELDEYGLPLLQMPLRVAPLFES